MVLNQICAGVTNTVSRPSTDKSVVIITINGVRRLHSRVSVATGLLFDPIYYQEYSSVV